LCLVYAAQAFVLVKHHHNTLLPVGAHLDGKVSCAERCMETSHRRALRGGLEEWYRFLPDCAATTLLSVVSRWTFVLLFVKRQALICHYSSCRRLTGR
jgi:hypothetical protein